MRSEIITGLLGAAIPNGGTLTLGYPTGTGSATFASGGGHVIVVAQIPFTLDAAQISISFGTSTFVVTNSSGQAWRIGSDYRMELRYPGGSLRVENSYAGANQEGTVSSPYRTLASANSASASGDVILVGPGTYDERNAFTGTVGVILDQAVIQYTGTTSGIIDDSSAGSNADMNVTVSGFGSFKMTGSPSANRGIIQANRAGSLVTFDVDRIVHTGTNTNCIGVWSILGEINGRAQQINTLDGTSIYWQGGNGNIYADSINNAPTGAISVANTAIAGAVTNANSKWHVTCPVVISTQFALRFGATNSSSRFWFIGERVIGDQCALIVEGSGASVVYITAQKLEASTTAATIYAAIHLGTSVDNATEVHITVQKVEGGANDASSGNIYMLAGRAWIKVLDELKDTGLTLTACVNMDGGEMDLSIGNLTRAVNFHAIDVRGGTLRLTDSYIDTSANAGKSALRGTNVATVTLRDVHLQVHSAADSIASIDATAFTVTCLGGCSANRPPGANVVIVGKLLLTGTSTLTLGASATTFVVTNNIMTITGDSGGNTIGTITGGYNGLELTLIFVDALVTITDTAADTASTVNLSAAFTSSARDTMTLIHNGTKWLEKSRSVN